MNKVKLSPYHLTFYYEQQLIPERHDYNIVFIQKVSGQLDIPRLSNAIIRLVKENFIYHSLITEIDEKYYWQKSSKLQKLEIIDDSTDVQIEKFIKQPFNLNTAPPCRFAVFLDKDKEEKYIFIAIFHHIIMDGAKGSIFSTISKYYNDGNYSESASIEEQKIILQGNTENHEAQIKKLEFKSQNYWKGYTKNQAPSLELVKIQTVEKEVIKTYDFTLKHNIYASYKTNLNLSSSDFNIFLTVFSILLSRYTGEEYIHISYPVTIDKRDILYLGAAINTVPACFHIDETNTFKKLLTQRNISFIGEIRNAKFPVYDIIKNTPIKKQNISFAQTNLKNEAFNFKNCKTEVVTDSYLYDIAGDSITLEYEIDNNKNINFRIKYINSYTTEFIKTLSKNYLYILEQCLTNPDKLLKNIQICNPEEYKTIVYDWNKTETYYPKDETIHQLFEKQVLKTPKKIALVYKNSSLSYEELNNKAEILACKIIDYFILTENRLPSQDTLIPLIIHKGINMIIGMLAILKAGAAYTPIAPDTPAERLKYILKDTRAKLILTSSNVEISLNLQSTITSINIDTIDFSNIVDSHRKNNATANNLAYVIYTSGTTGTPKGVMIEHKQIINTFYNLINSLRLNECKNCSYYSNFVFDASVFEIFPTLLVGSTLHIIPEETMIDESKLINFFNRSNIDKAFLPTAIFKQCYRKLYNTGLKKVHIGGEALRNISDWKHISLFNQYGPTEISVYCTELEVADVNEISIGKPIKNMKAYIHDRNLKICPVNVPGILYISGTGLARGYLNNSKLTNDKFIVNPYSGKVKRENEFLKLYKTGDVCKWSSEGYIKYLGRNDNQVKVNGFRIELGEIEARLFESPEVKQCAVLCKENNGNRYLIAYYTLNQLADNRRQMVDEKKSIPQPANNDLQTFISEKLPGYMIPNIFIKLDKMPLNTSGKIDRKALSAIAFKQKSKYYPPKTENEKKLVQIWGKILNQKNIGIKDNFYELGGNSILAIKLINKINKSFDLNLPVTTILKYPDIEKSAIQINIKRSNIESIKGFTYEL
jgi:amino acid adenylation domain-containing protein